MQLKLKPHTHSAYDQFQHSNRHLILQFHISRSLINKKNTTENTNQSTLNCNNFLLNCLPHIANHIKLTAILINYRSKQRSAVRIPTTRRINLHRSSHTAALWDTKADLSGNLLPWFHSSTVRRTTKTKLQTECYRKRNHNTKYTAKQYSPKLRDAQSS